jgi:hypothetical protein
VGKRAAVWSTGGQVTLLVAAALASGPGCSTIGPGSGGDGADAGADGGDPAGPDAAAELGPFSTPRLIEPLSDPAANEDDPTVTGDQLELFFNSNRSGNSNLWVSRRDSIDQPWGDPEPVMGTGINTSSNETAPEISTDGLRLYFSSNRDGGKGAQDIYVTRRDDRDAPWDMPELVPELNSTAGDYSPVEDGSGRTVYFFSTRDGGDQDLFVATRASVDDPWREPIPIAELNTADNDSDPFPTGDGRTLYFGSGPAGVLDLFVARRAGDSGEFELVDPIEELNSDAHDTDPWVSPAGRYMVLTSDRSGENELYEAER